MWILPGGILQWAGSFPPPTQPQGVQIHALSLMLRTPWLTGRMTGHRRVEGKGQGIHLLVFSCRGRSWQTRGSSLGSLVYTALLPGCHHGSLPSSWPQGWCHLCCCWSWLLCHPLEVHKPFPNDSNVSVPFASCWDSDWEDNLLPE